MLWDFRFSKEPRNFPAWIESDCVSTMRINERVKRSVLFIGIVDDKGNFVPYGTAFIGQWPESGRLFSYLITAKHVLDAMAKTRRPFAACLNEKNGLRTFGKIEMDHWTVHPTIDKCDVAVAPFIGSYDTFDILGVDLAGGCLTQEYIDENDIGAGDEVYTTGLLTAHFGKTKNTPVVRVGNIATMREPVDLGVELGVQEVYLIESRSIGGLSGSPVFLNTAPLRFIKGKLTAPDKHRLEYLVGVNMGLFETKAQEDTIPTKSAERREQFLDTMSAGIAIVAPIERAVEIIRDTPLLLEQRAKAIENMKKTQPFVPTSAASRGQDEKEAQVAQGDANPHHKEDFTALRDAAMRKPKQAG